MVCPLIWQFVENVRFLVIMCIGLYQEVEYFTDKNGKITHDSIHKKKNQSDMDNTKNVHYFGYPYTLYDVGTKCTICREY